MPPVSRIAIVDHADRGLRARIEAALPKARCEVFGDVVEDFDRIREFQPEAVVCAVDRLDAELIGAFRVLRHGLRAPRLAFEVAETHLSEAERLARRVDGRAIAAPASPTALREALERGPDTDRADQVTQEALIDLTRGISDEINNPLLFLTGHVQLLESLCDPSRDGDKLEQIAAVRRGLDRIATTMSKIRVMSRAHSLHQPLPSHPFAEILQRIRDDGSAAVRALVPDSSPQLLLPCDSRLLEAALRYLFEIGVELSRVATEVRVSILEGDAGVVVRTEISGLDFEEWQLPRAFDPYHLKSALRGTAHGLNLFLVQTVVHAHGGAATARRTADQVLTLDLSLPCDPALPEPGRDPR